MNIQMRAHHIIFPVYLSYVNFVFNIGMATYYHYILQDQLLTSHFDCCRIYLCRSNFIEVNKSKQWSIPAQVEMPRYIYIDRIPARIGGGGELWGNWNLLKFVYNIIIFFLNWQHNNQAILYCMFFSSYIINLKFMFNCRVPVCVVFKNEHG